MFVRGVDDLMVIRAFFWIYSVLWQLTKYSRVLQCISNYFYQKENGGNYEKVYEKRSCSNYGCCACRM